MEREQLAACIVHLEAAERLLEEADELAPLAWLALAIDRLRTGHGLPERCTPPSLVDLAG